MNRPKEPVDTAGNTLTPPHGGRRWPSLLLALILTLLTPQMRVKRSPPPPSPPGSDLESQLTMQQDKLTTILEQREDTPSIHKTTFSYVPELHPVPSSGASAAAAAPVYSRIMRRQQVNAEERQRPPWRTSAAEWWPRTRAGESNHRRALFLVNRVTPFRLLEARPFLNLTNQWSRVNAPNNSLPV